MNRDEARRALLTPLTDERAAALRLVTREQVEAALRAAPKPLPSARCWPATGRYR